MLRRFKNSRTRTRKVQKITARGDKKLQQSIECQEERFVKLLECVTKKESNSGNFNTFSQDPVINSVGKFIYNPEEEVTFEAHF